MKVGSLHRTFSLHRELLAQYGPTSEGNGTQKSCGIIGMTPFIAIAKNGDTERETCPPVISARGYFMDRMSHSSLTPGYHALNHNPSVDRGSMSFGYDRDMGGFSVPCGDRSGGGFEPDRSPGAGGSHGASGGSGDGGSGDGCVIM